MTQLRKMMLEELQRRNYSTDTIGHHLRAVEEFANYYKKPPDKLGLNELRSYQAYLLKERKLAVGTIVNHVAALRFFFVRTLKRLEFRDYLPYPREEERLPTVLSMDEVARLINASSNLFRRALLMTVYGTGMRRSEVVRLKVSDIDSKRMIIRVVQGKGGKDRDPASEGIEPCFPRQVCRRLKRLYRRRKLNCSGPAASLAAPKQFAKLLQQAHRQDWVVYAKPAFGGPAQVLRYLGRYTHRAAISNHRIVAFDGEHVTFRYKDYVTAANSA